MLTVRIFNGSGTQQVQEASSVIYFPEEDKRREHLHVFPVKETDPGLIIEDATVYVMNENGKTIAEYILG